MDILQAAMDVSLCRAVSVTADTSTRVPLPIRAGRIGASLAARAYRLDLRDHLVFPGLINAHDHLHVNAVPPLETGAPFPNSYAWIAAFQAHFAEPAVVAALQVPKALRLRHGALKNLLAGTTCVVHHDPWHAVLDESNFPVGLLRDYGWPFTLFISSDLVGSNDALYLDWEQIREMAGLSRSGARRRRAGHCDRGDRGRPRAAAGRGCGWQGSRLCTGRIQPFLTCSMPSQ